MNYVYLCTNDLDVCWLNGVGLAICTLIVILRSINFLWVWPTLGYSFKMAASLELVQDDAHDMTRL